LFVQGPEYRKAPNQGVYQLYWDLWLIMSTNIFLEIGIPAGVNRRGNNENVPAMLAIIHVLKYA